MILNVDVERSVMGHRLQDQEGKEIGSFGYLLYN